MRRGTVATVEPDVPSPRPPASPLSARLCDAALVAFALWTVCCHAAVAAGRGLMALLLLYAVVLTAGLVLWVRWRPRSVEAPPAAAPDAAAPVPPLVRVAALIAGVTAVLLFAVRRDVMQLWWSAVVVLVPAAVAVAYREAIRIPTPTRSRSLESQLWLLAAAAVVLTLVSHRPDVDDAFYMNAAVTTADSPGQALLSLDGMHGIAGLPLYLPVYRVHSFELLNGALSYLTGIPVIYCFHWLSAAAAALLAPLAWAALFRILTPRQWLASAVTLAVVLIAAGETHRWYGNFAFVRLWQGKSIFLTVVAPLLYAYALRFAARPNRRDWAMLAAAQIAAIGCTSSALWAAPVAAGTALCCGVRPSLRGLRTVLIGTFASAYVLAAAWMVRTSVVGIISVGATTRAQRAALSGPALENALFVALGDARLLIFAVAALLTAWVFAPPGLGRRFAVGAPLVMMLGLLNPYVAARVIANVTGPAFWRTMWALPVPILMTMVLAAPLYLDSRARPPTRRALWVGLLAAVAFLIPQYGGLSAQNFVYLGWPGLKVPDVEYRWAEAVNESVPQGAHVLVPTDVGAWIVTFHHHAFPLTVRSYLHTTKGVLEAEELLQRSAMQRFVDTPDLIEATPQQFRDGLDRFAVRAVCLRNAPSAATARAILEQASFRQTRRDEDYELWVRAE
jgi:hypothetical protein